MNRKLLLCVALLGAGLTQCMSIQRKVDTKLHGDNPYIEPPFYLRYTTSDSQLDKKINAAVAALKENPRSPALHNELGALLALKGFPKDAELEYRRAVLLDENFYPAWYNLGLIRQARGDAGGATRAYHHTLAVKPGHAAALFQMGLIEEKRGNSEQAIDYYVKAFSINHDLLDVSINPRILDTRLITQSLIRLYPDAHARRSVDFTPAPGGYQFVDHQAPSEVPAPAEIVTPGPPATESGAQTPAPGIQAVPSPATPVPPAVVVPSPTPAPPPPPENVFAPAPQTGGSTVPIQSVPIQSVPQSKPAKPKTPPPPPPKQ